MDGKPMFSEKERAWFSVSNSPMQAMITLTPLLLSFVKHVFFVYAAASALVQYTSILITQWDYRKRKGDVGFAITFVVADLFCVLTIISYFLTPHTVNAIVSFSAPFSPQSHTSSTWSGSVNAIVSFNNTFTIGMAVEAFIIAATKLILGFWSGLLLINTIDYLRKTSKP
jgi:hypothetical protein